tara:strand:- start:174 stop:440 length:267 start_codon:yes stop_codon:yes gene_type:complete
MRNSITKMFPGLTFKKADTKEGTMRSKIELARITGLKVTTVSRYLSAAGITADEFRKISIRNNHNQSFYNQTSQNKFFDWLCGTRECK